MTEDEAKEKLCVGPPHVSMGLTFGKCAASACMAWRWAQKPNPDWKPTDSTMSWEHPATQRSPWVRDEASGGCGLAGSPQ